MKKKNLPAVITLSAGAIACITCIVKKYPILDTLITVLITLIIFYFVGLIASKYITKINKAANDAYIIRERERMKAEKETNLQNKEDTEDDIESDTTDYSSISTDDEEI